MKRRIISLIAMVLLLSQLACPALAEDALVPEVKICSSYWEDGVLHTFAQFSQEDPTSLETTLLVSNAMMQQVHPETLQDAGASIHYMLLIDASSSMASFRTRITYLARELMKTQQNVHISVAQFGSGVSLVAADLTQWEEVRAALNSISYNKEVSNITGCAAEALEMLGKEGYADGGEMTNLVVITDGEAWYSDDTQTEQQMELQANTYAKRMIAAYPEIVIHTFSFGQWNTEAQEILQDHRGLHGAGSNAATVGQELAEYADSMYSVTFNLSGYGNDEMIPDEMMLSVGRSLVSYGPVRNTGLAPTVELPPAQTDATEEVPADTTEPPTNPVVEPTTEATSGEGAETTATEASTEASSPDNTETSETEETTGTDEDSQDDPKPKKFSVWYVAAAAGCLVLVLLALLLWKKRVPKGAIRMRIELVAGGNVRLRNVYYLDREILIGSGKTCDIIIPDGTKDSANARLFKQNQVIYVEDIGLSDGILLNGMRIFSSNRLRSGDEITIGAVTLRVLF